MFVCICFSIEVDAKEHIHRSALSPSALVHRVYDDVKTLYDAFQRGLKLSANRPMMGMRSNGKEQYKYETYAEVKTTKFKLRCLSMHCVAVVLVAYLPLFLLPLHELWFSVSLFNTRLIICCFFRFMNVF